MNVDIDLGNYGYGSKVSRRQVILFISFNVKISSLIKVLDYHTLYVTILFFLGTGEAREERNILLKEPWKATYHCKWGEAQYRTDCIPHIM